MARLTQVRLNSNKVFGEGLTLLYLRTVGIVLTKIYYVVQLQLKRDRFLIYSTFSDGVEK